MMEKERKKVSFSLQVWHGYWGRKKGTMDAKSSRHGFRNVLYMLQ